MTVWVEVKVTEIIPTAPRRGEVTHHTPGLERKQNGEGKAGSRPFVVSSMGKARLAGEMAQHCREEIMSGWPWVPSLGHRGKGKKEKLAC